MYAVSDLEKIFQRNSVGYWTIQDNRGNVGNTSSELVDVKDSDKQYADFVEALDDLKDDTYKVNLFSSQKASASKKQFAFIKGDGGNTSKVGNTRDNMSRDSGNSTSLMMMMMQMMRDSDKKQMDLMMMMMQSQIANKDIILEKSLAHQDAIHKAQAELEREKMNQNKSMIDKAIGAITNPNFAKVVGAFNGATAAVGVASSAEDDQVEPTPTVPPQNDQNKRLFDLFTRIKGHFPMLNPLDTIEVLLHKLDENPDAKAQILGA